MITKTPHSKKHVSFVSLTIFGGPFIANNFVIRFRVNPKSSPNWTCRTADVQSLESRSPVQAMSFTVLQSKCHKLSIPLVVDNSLFLCVSSSGMLFLPERIISSLIFPFYTPRRLQCPLGRSHAEHSCSLLFEQAPTFLHNSREARRAATQFFSRRSWVQKPMLMYTSPSDVSSQEVNTEPVAEEAGMAGSALGSGVLGNSKPQSMSALHSYKDFLIMCFQKISVFIVLVPSCSARDFFFNLLKSSTIQYIINL